MSSRYNIKPSIKKDDLYDDTESYFVFNPKSHLSIYNQREGLPIRSHKKDILFCVETHSVTILVGETGSGKTTQIPQYLYESGWTRNGRCIAVTQPRQIAAINITNRVAQESGLVVGDQIGYSVRFDNNFNVRKGVIKFLTDDMLIREIMNDPLLSDYSVIMLDEIHERSVSTDLLMGLVKKILRKRRDLRIIISSATMEAQKLKSFFDSIPVRGKLVHPQIIPNNAMILHVEGRSFPVDIYYLQEPAQNYLQTGLETVLAIHLKGQPGDILLFLPGEDEVHEACNYLKETSLTLNSSDPTIPLLVPIPLHSSLKASQQLKAFLRTDSNCRKVVVSTNIAETSVTIPGVEYVIDCMFERSKIYDSKTRCEIIKILPISKASAEQRRGRAGRTAPGKCYRLCTEKDYDKLLPHTVPDIQKSDLATALMQLKALGIDNLNRFEFPSPPTPERMAESLELMLELGLIDKSGRMTKLGENACELPLHPRLAKALITSGEMGCSEEILTISAMTSIRNVFINAGKLTSSYKQSMIDKSHGRFSVREGDHITLLNIFTSFLPQQKSTKWAKSLHLNHLALQKAIIVRNHLRNIMKRLSIPFVSCKDEIEPILKCLLGGYFDNIAQLQNDGSYKAIGGAEELKIHSSSVLFAQAPRWILFDSVVEGRSMKNVTIIEPKWLLELREELDK